MLLDSADRKDPIGRNLGEAFANLIGDQRCILTIDEVTYAAESDKAFLPALQHAWDQQLNQSQLIVRYRLRMINAKRSMRRP